jgi:hypothetical protein
VTDDDAREQRQQLRQAIARAQKVVYGGVGMAGGGILCACIAFTGFPLAIALGLGAAAVMVPLGILRARGGMRQVSEATRMLESLERTPLPEARVVKE